MTYYGSKELAEAFRTVRNNTIKVAEEIPEQHYGYRVAPECRSVAEMLVHVATAPRMAEQIHITDRLTALAGFDFFSFIDKLKAEEKTPRTKSQILELLRSEGDRFAKALEALPESSLAERVEFPQGMVPPSKTRFEMLLGSKEHEMHHRGQLMLIQRALGITPHLTRQMEERIAAMRPMRASG
jgi:uncharacterized damage-inducible protein DinB